MPLPEAASCEEIELIIPSQESELLVVRLMVAGALAVCQLDVDMLEDVKTAVNEACYLLIHQPSSCKKIRVGVSRIDEIAITVSGCGAVLDKPRETPLDTEVCLMVLKSLIERTQIEVDGQHVVAIRMHVQLK